METPRLLLRPWAKADAGALYKYASDPLVGPATGWQPHSSVEESREVIRTVLSVPETYAIIWKETGEPIGSIGLMEPRVSAEESGKALELGYWTARPYWGRGIMPEAVERVLKRAFEELGCDKLWCAYFDGNAQSARVAEKCGFSYDHSEEVDWKPLNRHLTEHFTSLTRREWKRGLITRRLSRRELPQAMELAWEVYVQCLAPHTSQEGVETFCTYVRNPANMENRVGFGAFEGGKMVAMLLVREGEHISLFFVRPERQRQGIGSSLMETALRYYDYAALTVHAAPEAMGAYERMGFRVTGDETVEDGIRYVPMEYESVAKAY